MLSENYPNSIYTVLNNLKEQNYNFTRNKCPDEITLDMLVKELDGIELRALMENNGVGKDGLWESFYLTMFVNNLAGLSYQNEKGDIISDFDFEFNSMPNTNN
jgi:hypothetical protein